MISCLVPSLRRSIPFIHRARTRAMIGGMILIGLYGCQDVSINAVDVATLAVAPSEVSLRAGETLQLAATLRDTEGNILHERPVAWKSEDGEVAVVGADGVVEARGAGETRIRATAGEAEAVATVRVSAAASIVVSDDELRFDAESGEGPTSYRTLEVAAGGDEELSGLSATIHYPAGQEDGWLDADLERGRTPTTLRARASAQDLDRGIHEAEIRIRSGDAEAQRTVRVVFAVDAPAPSIRLSTATVEFERVAGESAPSPQSVEVTNDGGGQLSGLDVSVHYSSGQPDNWLSASLASSTAPATLALSVASSSPPPGSYEATVRVSSPVADNSPRSLTVVLEVEAAGVSRSRSSVSASPDEIEADGESTSTITVQLRDSDGDPVAPSGTSVSVHTTRGTVGEVDNRGGGRYTATLTASTSAGTATVTARVNGSTLEDDATVRITESDDPPSSGSMSVGSITYETHGGPDDDRHLRITVRILDAQGDPVSGADVKARITRTLSQSSIEAEGTTGSDGRMAMMLQNFQPGCVVTTVLEVEKSGLEWDGSFPENEFCK